MSEMEQTADHLIVIGRGRLIVDTTMRDFIERGGQGHTLVRSPQNAALRRVLEGAGASVRPADQGAWQVRGADAATIGVLATEHQIVLHELSPRYATLEEIYTRMTQGTVDYHGGMPTNGGAAAPGRTEHTLTIRSGG